MAYRISIPLAETQFPGDDKPKKKKIKRKDRKVLSKATSSGKAADYKYTMPVPGSVKGDAVTVKKKKYKGELTPKQKKRISRIEKSDKNKEKRNPSIKSNRAKIKQNKIKEKNLKKDTDKKNKVKQKAAFEYFKQNKIKEKNLKKDTDKKNKAKQKAAFDRLTPEEKKRAKKTSRQQTFGGIRNTITKDLGIRFKKSDQAGKKNMKGRNDPNKGTAGQNTRKTKQSCKKNRSASGCK